MRNKESQSALLGFAPLPYSRVKARPLSEHDLPAVWKMMSTVLAEPQFSDASKGYRINEVLAWYQADMSHFYEEFEGPADRRRFAVVILDRHSDEVVGVGTMTARPTDAGKTSDCAEITQIYLLEEYRHLGLGLWLAHGLLNKARSLGYNAVFLTTRNEFEDAVRLYRGLGFVDVENTRYPGVTNSFALELKLN